MFCALSGQVATTPVVSPKSGSIFEKSLIESYISTAGKDPVSEAPLSAAELIPLRSQNPPYSEPKPPVYNSIPTMLQAFQNEWDALALETFQLRKHLSDAREELSSALYKYDAAIRVIARLTSERDEAREALGMLSEAAAQATKHDTTAEEAAEETDLAEPSSASKEEEAAKTLVSARERLFSLHKASKFALATTKTSQVQVSEARVLAGAQVYAISGGEAAVSGGEETRVISLESLEQLESFPQAYTALSFLQTEPFGVCGSQVKFLRQQKSFDVVDIQNVSAHPSEPLFVVTGKNSFSLCDSDGPISTIDVGKDISASDLHVDGTLFGIAHDNVIVLYDLTNGQKASEIAVEKDHVVTKLRFALNGYWLVAATTGPSASTVVVYDLRKNSLLHTFSFAVGATDFVMDPSCQVLVTSNASLQVHLYTKKGKSWRENVKEVDGGLGSMTLASTAEQFQTDSELKVCGLQDDQLVEYRVSFS